ncbi:hypothetical protein B2I21_28100 [Chryseobacterium mucoviscidosis]|nr:hypothetical protein B2I21_28100 [Chryseobacterium mucoviscidosis]
MDSRLTYLEQDLVNILASMTLNIANYPKVFFEAGYRIEFTEREFDVQQKGKDVEVKFDLVLNNLEKNHAISFECKSGKTEAKQLSKYGGLSPQEMVENGGVSSNDLSTHTHDIAIVYNKNNHEYIIEETKQYDFILFSVSKEPTLIASTGKTIYDDDLEFFFSQPIDYPSFIHEVFKIGASTPKSKYISLVSASLVELSLNDKEVFTLQDLAASVATTYPGLYPTKLGKRLCKEIENKIEIVLNDGVQHELKGFVSWDSKAKSGRLMRIKPGCKPSTFKTFRDLAQEMSERLRTNSPINPKYKTNREKIFESQVTIDDLVPEGQL